MNDYSRHSTYLFAEPSMLDGVARTLDLWGGYDRFNSSPTPAAADALAVLHDWRAVGDDLRAAMSGLLDADGQLSLFPSE